MIPESITEKQLTKLCRKYGKIKELVLLRNPDGESKRCGFVKYTNHYDALGAINALNGSFIKNSSTHPLVVKFADSKPAVESIPTNPQYYPNPIPSTPFPSPYYYPPPPLIHPPPRVKSHRDTITGPEGCNLFVMRFPSEWTDQDLFMRFSPFGNILSASVFIDKHTKISKGFGFVSFDNPSSAKLAIQELDGVKIHGKRLTVQLKKRDSPY